MKSWDLSAVDLKPRLPEILSSSDDARAVALDLATGEALSDHEVHERAWIVVLGGEVEVSSAADGKVHLFPPEFEESAPLGLYRFQPDPGTDQFPLTLISPASERTISSTLGELPRPDVKLTMHPANAEARGLAENDQVRMFNDLGEVQCTLKVAPSIRPGTISLPKGIWRRSTPNSATGTALVPDTLTDLGGGACFNDARVQVASLANG